MDDQKIKAALAELDTILMLDERERQQRPDGFSTDLIESYLKRRVHEADNGNLPDSRRKTSGDV